MEMKLELVAIPVSDVDRARDFYKDKVGFNLDHGTRRELLVYDPFMGIGNTALACLNLGVNYIGTEIDENYIKVAKEQIKERNIASLS